VVEPESEEMNTSVLTVRGVDGPQVGETGMPVEVVGGKESESRCWAVRRGPIVLVCRWWAKFWNVLVDVSLSPSQQPSAPSKRGEIPRDLSQPGKGKMVEDGDLTSHLSYSDKLTLQHSGLQHQ
jgi:hypothetical protein